MDRRSFLRLLGFAPALPWLSKLGRLLPWAEKRTVLYGPGELWFYQPGMPGDAIGGDWVDIGYVEEGWDVHVDKPLTELSLHFTEKDGVATLESVLPVVGVEQDGSYFTWH